MMQNMQCIKSLFHTFKIKVYMLRYILGCHNISKMKQTFILCESIRWPLWKYGRAFTLLTPFLWCKCHQRVLVIQLTTTWFCFYLFDWTSSALIASKQILILDLIWDLNMCFRWHSLALDEIVPTEKLLLAAVSLENSSSC